MKRILVALALFGIAIPATAQSVALTDADIADTIHEDRCPIVVEVLKPLYEKEKKTDEEDISASSFSEYRSI